MANLKNNTTTIQEILDAVNALPEAGSGGVDVSGVTASPDDVMEGKVIVDADGNEQVGIIPEITAQNVIITPENEVTKRYTIPEGRHDGTGSVRIITQSKTVTPSTDEQTITADSGYTLQNVSVEAIPSTYIQPTSTQAAKTWTPTTSTQSIPAGTYCSGKQTIGAIPSSYVQPSYTKSGGTYTLDPGESLSYNANTYLTSALNVTAVASSGSSSIGTTVTTSVYITPSASFYLLDIIPSVAGFSMTNLIGLVIMADSSFVPSDTRLSYVTSLFVDLTTMKVGGTYQFYTGAQWYSCSYQPGMSSMTVTLDNSSGKIQINVGSITAWQVGGSNLSITPIYSN